MKQSIRVLYALAVVALVHAAPASAQQVSCPDGTEFNGTFCARTFDAPVWVGHVAHLGANALLGGLAAGVMQEFRGGDFRDGFTRGALGGAVVYAGKRIAVQPFDGAGMVGRQVGSVGGSMVRNAAEGRGLLERVVLPLGPVRVYLEPAAATPLRARLDVVSAAWIGYAVVEEQLEWDRDFSLSAGTAVFRAPGKMLKSKSTDLHEGAAGGLEAAGVILLSDVEEYGKEPLLRSFAHERVHVLQTDYMHTVWSDPAEDWLLRQIPGGRAVGRFLDFGVSNPIRSGLGRFIPGGRENHPWEIEAEFLERYR